MLDITNHIRFSSEILTPNGVRYKMNTRTKAEVILRRRIKVGDEVKVRRTRFRVTYLNLPEGLISLQPLSTHIPDSQMEKAVRSPSIDHFYGKATLDMCRWELLATISFLKERNAELEAQPESYKAYMRELNSR